jgi:hypothetical protein
MPVHVTRWHLVDEAVGSLVSWYDHVSTWADANFKDLAYEEFREQFWRTLILDWTGSRGHGDSGVRASPEFRRNFEAHERYAKLELWIGTNKEHPSEELQSRWREGLPFVHRLERSCNRRRLCRTDGGVMAMVPEMADAGDQIWIFLGIPVPFVIRRTIDSNVLIGPCYVHGMMDGQALKSESWTTSYITLT